jgi:hypothetical protein
MNYKIAFDQQSDFSGKQLYSMLSDIDLPDYVKTAEVEDAYELKELPKTAFADAERRIYPINTPARVYVSNAHFINKKADILKLYGESYASQLQNNIEKAAEIFDILEDLQSYNSHFNVKTASDYVENYMVNFEVSGMSAPVQLYPVKTAQDLIQSAEHFVKNIKNFPFEIRVKSAENFVKAAADLDVDDMPELLMKYAGMYYPDILNLNQELWRRSTKLTKEAHKQIYKAISDDVENINSLQEVMKIAETCFNIENMEGLYEKKVTAQLLGDPVDCFFTEPVQKIASDLNYVEVHGDKYKMADLIKISKEKYEEAFGDCGIDPENPEKIADILPTMPRSDVKLLEEITGLRPIK